MQSYFYPHTCPNIDRGIRGFQSELDEHVQEILDQVFNEIEDKLDLNGLESYINQKDILKNRSENIYNSFESYFEDVRETNSDMRSYAESYIEDLESELRSEIDDLEDKIQELENQVDQWKEKYNELKEELYEKENI